MTNPPKNHDELIFAYLDGDLDPQQLADFKAILESDPAIQSRLDALNAMNTSLIRIAQEPTSAPLVLEPKQTTKTSPRRWISYAAILAITTALFLYMNPSQPKAVFDTQNVYRQITTAFEPQIVCDSPEKFVAYTQESFGKPITVDFQTPIQLVGWRYLGKNYNPGRPTKVPTTRILMAQTPEGTRILVAFVPRGLPAPKAQPGSDLHVFKKSVQSVRVYEITPLDSPSVLDLLN
tara:strand:- start:233988 stop:234692 length:705 start_codon:yes stop_codon:yes gene_type:complete